MSAAPASGLPAAAAAMPRPMVRRKVRRALFIPSSERAMCPPAAWPVSWAMTPISWLGFSASFIMPVKTRIVGPEVVWALISLVPIRMSFTVLGSSPAAMKTGSHSWWRVSSISVSRRMVSASSD